MYNYVMDIDLQNAWHQFRVTNSSEDGIILAKLLLHLNTLDYYEENMANDPKIIAVIRYLRKIAIPEASEVIDQLTITLPFASAEFGQSVYDTIAIDPTYLEAGRWIFRDSEEETIFKFTNVYCNQTPIASIRIKNYYELRTTLDWCKTFFAPLKLMMPPKQITVSTLGAEKYFFVPTFKKEICDSYQFIVEDESSFDFLREEAPPIYIYQHGQTEGKMRKITDDEYFDDGRGLRYKQFDYDMLPKFARPKKIKGSPHYIVIGTTIRQQVSGFSDYGDEGEWSNFTFPIAKIYLGYIENFLQQNAMDYRWRWAPPTYLYLCESCQYSEEHYSGELGSRAPSPIEKCPDCRSYWDRTITQPTRLEINPEYMLTPQPPPHINQAIAFLESFFDYINDGDIYSSRGGEELSISLSEGVYGPDND